jgi:hypothetical protein
MMNSRWTSRPSLSIGLAGSMTAVGRGWRGGTILAIAGLSGAGALATVGSVVVGLRMYVFMNIMVYVFKLRSQRGTEKCRVQPIMASNRRWRCQFRCRGPRCESVVAQLSTLGGIDVFYETPYPTGYFGTIGCILFGVLKTCTAS